MSNVPDKLFFSRPFPCHVALFASFPALSLYASNIRETDFGMVILPLSLSAGAAVILWGVLTVLLRDGRKAGFSAALFLLAFFSYGHFYSLLEGWGFPAVRHSRMIAALIVIWGYLTYLIRINRRDPKPLTTILNLAALVLVLISVARIAIYEVTLPRLRRPAATPAEPEYEAAASAPDIYFVVLDEFAHPRTMADNYDYDAGQFINGLIDRGFFIADQSRTITPKTPQALAQILNMEYLTPGWYWDEDERQFQESDADHTRDYVHPRGKSVFRKIGFNRVCEVLRSGGYRCVYFGSFAEIGKWDRIAESGWDEYHNYYSTSKSSVVTEFQTIFWQTTMLRLMFFGLFGGRYESYYRRGLLETLAHLKRIPGEPGPKFVFAHIMAPHEPFVFGPRGEPVEAVNSRNYADRRFYLGQYIYISERILEVIDDWKKESTQPPIIVVQSDHGLRPTHPGVEVGPDEWEKILNAIHLPGPGKDELYDSISPVNTFRLIFNHYLDAQYRLPEDRTRQPES